MGMKTHVNVSTITTSPERVLTTNVEAVVVSVERAHGELDTGDIGDSAAVGNVPLHVVAGSGDPAVSVGVPGPHGVDGGLGEGLTGGVPVVDGEQLVEEAAHGSGDGSSGSNALSSAIKTGSGAALGKMGIGVDFGVDISLDISVDIGVDTDVQGRILEHIKCRSRLDCLLETQVLLV